MAYKYYNAYLSATPSSPQESYKNDLQALIDNQFYNASDTYTIQEELIFGSLQWSDVDVRITHVINSDTGEKLGDDWRGIIFKDMDHLYGLGHRYKFNDYIWLTIFTDYYKFVTASATIRRCNYILKWYNTDATPILIQEPCIVDYFKLTSIHHTEEDQYMRLGANIRYVYLQNNSESIQLKRDKRFIVDDRAYRIIDYDRITRPGLIELTLEEHQINNATDDIVNGIANAFNNSSNNGTMW